MRFGFLLLAFLIAACSGKDNPVGNSPPLPAANIVTTGQSSWIACTVTFGCLFQGEGRNEGPGCATAVRGTVKFYNAQDQQLGTAYEWALVAGQILRPNESFSYKTLAFIGVDPTITAYRSSPSWTNVACP